MQEAGYQVSLDEEESNKKFKLEKVSNNLQQISDLLNSTEDLFEEFLNIYDISILDYPYWKGQYSFWR